MKGGHPLRSDIAPGGAFPDYALPDHTGTVRTPNELQGRPGWRGVAAGRFITGVGCWSTWR